MTKQTGLTLLTKGKMKITNLFLYPNGKRVTWDYNGKEHEFVFNKPKTFGQASDFVDSIDEADMWDFESYLQPSNYIELLGMVMANGRKINLIS